MENANKTTVRYDFILSKMANIQMTGNPKGC